MEVYFEFLPNLLNSVGDNELKKEKKIKIACFEVVIIIAPR